MDQRLFGLAVGLATLASASRPLEAGGIYEAIRTGELAPVQAELERDPTQATARTAAGWTPLHEAAGTGNRDVVSLLVEKGAPVNATDDAGTTPMHVAARHGKKLAAWRLIHCRGNVHARDKTGATPLHLAAQAGHGTWVLTAHGAVILSRPEFEATGRMLEQAQRELWRCDDREVVRRLSKPISFEVHRWPLSEAATFVAAVIGVPVTLDPRALKGKRTPRISLSVDSLRTDVALKWVCRQAGLVYVWRDGAILITTPELARRAVRRTSD